MLQKYKKLILVVFLALLVAGGVLGVGKRINQTQAVGTGSAIRGAAPTEEDRQAWAGFIMGTLNAWYTALTGESPNTTLLNDISVRWNNEILAIRQDNTLTREQQDQKIAGLETKYRGQFDARMKKADEESKATSLSTILMNVLGWIFWVISAGFSLLVVKMVSVRLYIMTLPLNINNVEIVKQGWGVVRDICNNFFIVILLVIAVSTVLQIPNHHWRQLLPKLLIMAVLINFSKLFVGILIDASQILMLTFAQPLSGVTGNNIILAALGMPDLFKMSDEQGFANLTAQNGISGWDVIIALIFALIVGVVALVVIVCITIILIYRLVILLFLTILSPLPFLLTTFPKGREYAGQWWGELTKYLVVGPVMIFFLWISFMAMGGNQISPQQGSSYTAKITTELTANSSNPSDTAFLQGRTGQLEVLSQMASTKGIVNFLIVVMLMVGSLVMGQKMGVKGGEWAGKGLGVLDKMRKGTMKAPFKAGRAAVRGFEARTGVGAGALRLAARIPGLRTAVTPAAVAVAGATAKREQTKISNRAAALRVDDKNEQELRQLANGGDRYQRIAAVQSMVKRGLMRDDDKDNRNNNIQLMKQTKKLLPPELASTFTENAKKYTPALAFEAVYKDDKGKFKSDDFISDVRTAKVKPDEMLPYLDLPQFDELNEAVGQAIKRVDASGKALNDSLGFFIQSQKYISEKDIGEMNEKLTPNQNTRLWGSINKDTWERERDATTGEMKLTQSGEKMRDKFNKSTNFDYISQTFDRAIAAEVENINTFVSSNKSDIGKKMKNITDEFFKNFGQAINIGDFKDRSDDIKKKVGDSFQRVIDAIPGRDINTMAADKREQYKKKLKNALMSGASLSDAQLNKTNPENNERRNVLTEILQYATTGDTQEMKNLTKNNTQREMASQELPINVIKGLTASEKGSVIGRRLVDEVRRQAAGKPPTSPEAQRADKLKDL